MWPKLDLAKIHLTLAKDIIICINPYNFTKLVNLLVLLTNSANT